MNWFKRLFSGYFSRFSVADKRRMLDWNSFYLETELQRRKGGVNVNDMSGEGDLVRRLSEGEIRQLIKIRKLGDQADSASGYQAISLYKQVSALAPWDEISVMSIGVEYANVGDFANALKWLKKASQLNPSNARVRANLQNVQAAAR